MLLVSVLAVNVLKDNHLLVWTVVKDFILLEQVAPPVQKTVSNAPPKLVPNVMMDFS